MVNIDAEPWNADWPKMLEQRRRTEQVAKHGDKGKPGYWRYHPGVGRSIARWTRENQGSTTHPLTGEVVQIGDQGYGVAYEGFEEKISLDNFNQDFVTQFVMKHKERLKDENTFVGTWIDEDFVYLDLSEVVDSLAEAQKIGIKRNQFAVFDYSTGDVVEVSSARTLGKATTWGEFKGVVREPVRVDFDGPAQEEVEKQPPTLAELRAAVERRYGLPPR